MTPYEVVMQSYLCHRDWNVRDHAEYLLSEEDFSAAEVAALPIDSWLRLFKGGYFAPVQPAATAV